MSGLSKWTRTQLAYLDAIPIAIPSYAIVIIVYVMITTFTEVTSNTATATVFLPILASLVSLSFSLFRRPRGGQSGREKRRDKSFQAQAEKPLGTDSHRTISKRSRECWLLIGHKKCFVLLCPIGEQHLLSSFREFVHDGFD